MRVFPTNFSTAINSRGVIPVTLIKIDIDAFGGNPALTLRLSTKGESTDKTRFNTGTLDWLTLITDLSDITQDVDANTGFINADAKLDVTVLNFESDLFTPIKRFSSIFRDYRPDNSTVKVYQWFADEGLVEADITNDSLLIFSGVLTAPADYNEGIARFQVSQVSASHGLKPVGRTLALGDYPSAPEESIGKFLPIPIGAVEKTPGIKIYTAAETRLSGVLLPTDSITSVATTAGFPISGTFLIDEYQIQYTGRTATSFTGCSGIVEIHYRGNIVSEKLTNYPYLLCDKNFPIKGINNIYNAGHLLPPADYTLDLAEATVTFDKKPQFEDSQDSRFLFAHFDTVDGANTSVTPLDAIDSNETTDAAKISAGYPVFAVKQVDVLQNQGQIGRAFIQVAHHASGLMPSDSIAVEVVGEGSLGTLSKPGQEDATTIVGDIDFSLNVLDTITTTFNDPGHQHSTSGGGATQISQSANSGTGTASIFFNSSPTAGGTYFHDIGFPSFTGIASSIEYSLTINVTSIGQTASTLPFPTKLGPIGQTVSAGLITSTGSVSISAILVGQSNTVQFTCPQAIVNKIIFLTSGNYTAYNFIRFQVTAASRVITIADGSIISNMTGGSVNKSGTVEVTKSALDLTALNADSTSNTHNDHIEITSLVNGDWDWFTNKVLKLTYTGSADGRTAYLIVARLVIEYAANKITFSDEITADIDGVTDDGAGTITGTPNLLLERPDHVFQWSIENAIGLPNSIIDSTNFAATGAKFASEIFGGYKFAGVIDEKTEIREWWAKWGKESRGVLYFDLGKARLFFRPLTFAASGEVSLRAIGPSAIIKQRAGDISSLSLERTRVEDVVNSVNLSFKKILGGDGYAKQTQAIDSVSIARYGKRESDDDFNFDFVRVDAMAESLRDFYVNELKETMEFANIDVLIGNMDLERFDWFSLAHPVLSLDGSFFPCSLLGPARQIGNAQGLQGDVTRLTARLDRTPGILGDIFAGQMMQLNGNVMADFTTIAVDGTLSGNIGQLSGTGAGAVVAPRIAKIITTVGSAKMSSTQSIFGSTSGRFDSTGAANHLTTPHHSDFNFGLNDFTIEFDYFLTGSPQNSASMGMAGQYSVGTDRWEFSVIGVQGASVTLLAVSPFTLLTFAGSGAIMSGGWNHIAISRESGTFRKFDNGVLSVTNGANLTWAMPTMSLPLTIGTNDSNFTDVPRPLYMKDFRVSDNARYTAAFAPHTAAHVTDANTILLVHCDGAAATTSFLDDV